MNHSPQVSRLTLNKLGAAIYSILRGSAHNNEGLRLQVLESQTKGEGPLTGTFVILDAGDNKHSANLAQFLHRPTNAAEILRIIRADHPVCVSVVNANILVVEMPSSEDMPDLFDTDIEPYPRIGVVSDPDFQVSHVLKPRAKDIG